VLSHSHIATRLPIKLRSPVGVDEVKHGLEDISVHALDPDTLGAPLVHATEELDHEDRRPRGKNDFVREKTLARLEHKCDVCSPLALPELTEVPLQIRLSEGGSGASVSAEMTTSGSSLSTVTVHRTVNESFTR